MKKGVMLINTSRGGIINTEHALKALNNGKIGYLGLDVYEHEKELLDGHQHDEIKDPCLTQLLVHPNVIVTPHQAYLTVEALHEIAVQTICNLDQWQKDISSDKACA
jgi:D-lactate dehydrogenase